VEEETRRMVDNLMREELELLKAVSISLRLVNYKDCPLPPPLQMHFSIL
jgi:hypothetical protein